MQHCVAAILQRIWIAPEKRMFFRRLFTCLVLNTVKASLNHKVVNIYGLGNAVILMACAEQLFSPGSPEARSGLR
jgi:hypothetical protein